MHENPILEIRERAGLTQAELAAQLGITEQTIRRTEQGTYTTIPKSILLWAYSAKGSSSDLIQMAYNEWKKEKRRELAPIINKISIYPWDCRDHPFKSLRVRFMDRYLANVSTDKINSMSGFCKVVAINPRILNNWETSYSSKIPPEVESLLRDMQYRGISDLREALQTWRALGTSGKSRP